VINPIIYAELSAGFKRIESVERSLDWSVFDYQSIPKEAAFLTGQVFAEYRKRGGSRSTPLPDFFIGAHASVMHLPLLTRDRQRFETNFPRLALITPD